ncbi:MAG: hypothetical protein RL141_230 [Candidatus Parcubacteria bacterium]|jgi:hypothetical protein
MALEATHLRFAKDMADILCITNRADYYAGCVYPDSRYVTQVPRRATHGAMSFLSETSDFEKGWSTHILYDRLVGTKYAEHSSFANQPIVGFNESWAYSTAAKIIEDQHSYAVLGQDVRLLQELTPPKVPPHQENQEPLENYYQALHTLYRQRPSLDGYLQLLQAFSIPIDIARHVVTTADALGKDPKAVGDIEALYESSLQEGVAKIQLMINS